MRTLTTLAVGGFIVAGCAGSWTKPGATDAQLGHDIGTCRLEAAQQFPVAVVYHYSNSVPQAPPRQECTTQNGQTRCVTIPGTYSQPTPQPVDLNAQSRAGAINSCLEGRGYTYTRK